MFYIYRLSTQNDVQSKKKKQTAKFFEKFLAERVKIFFCM